MELFIGLLLPPIIEIVNKDVHNENERYLIALITSLLAAAFIDWNLIIHAHVITVLQTVAVYATEAQLMFNLYWKDSFLRKKLQVNLGVDPNRE